MVNIHKKLSEHYKTKMILQVHDELIFDAYRKELDEVKKIVKYEMENAVQLKVPLIVDIGTGNNWLEAH
jgi:DNA polymerase-1